MCDKDVSDKIIRNTAFNILAKVWFSILGLLLTPYIMQHLGVERFGVLSLVGVLTSYLGLLDLGVGNSFVKYVSQFYAIKDFLALNRLVVTGFLFYAILGVLMLSSSFFLIKLLVLFFKIPVFLSSEAEFVFLLGIATLCVSNAFGPFIAIIPGLQRMDIANIISILVSFVTVIGTVFSLKQGWGLSGLMITNATVVLLTVLANMIITHRLLPQFSFHFRFFDGSLLKRIFKFGFQVQFSRISSTITTHTDKLLITYFLNLALVSFYQLGSTIVSYAMSIPALLVSPFVPAFSELSARQQRQKLIDVYLRSTKYLAFVTVPIFMAIAVQSHRIMRVWMGSGFEQAGLVIQILCSAYLLNMFARLSSAFAMSIEKTDIMMKSSLITIIVNIIASILFIKLLGFAGVAWGTAIAVNLGTWYFLRQLHKKINITWSAYTKVTMPFLGCGILAFFVQIILDIWLNYFKTSRLIEAVIMVACLIFSSVIYMILVLVVKIFDDTDRSFIKEKFPAFSNWLERWLGKIAASVKM
ncbi:MAG: polysaccharide biosynthesis C-terminal domain-containing protein [Candidatus Omnitrophica bacterium]|nr:polysaccharide biosynthesis C-terminal domain-containing protein [Candidatus Omnitrophota bacterium]